MFLSLGDHEDRISLELVDLEWETGFSDDSGDQVGDDAMGVHSRGVVLHHEPRVAAYVSDQQEKLRFDWVRGRHGGIRQPST